MSSLDRNDFPDTVIFLETAARPFVSAVKPIIDKVLRDREMKKPTMLFFQTFSGPDILLANELERSARERGEIAANEEYKDFETRKIAQKFPNNKKLDALEKFVRRSRIRKNLEISQLRSIMKKRAGDIMEKTQAENILFIDDYSQAERTTMKEVDREFAPFSSKDKKRSYFTFLSGKNIYADIDKDLERRIVVGAIDPKVGDLNEEGDEFTSTIGFEFLL